MSEEVTYSDDYLKLKEEMQEQFRQLRESFEASNKEKDDIIAELKEQNQGLQRALVRSATIDPPEPVKEPTAEDLYKSELEEQVSITKKYMELYR